MPYGSVHLFEVLIAVFHLPVLPLHGPNLGVITQSFTPLLTPNGIISQCKDFGHKLTWVVIWSMCGLIMSN